MKTYLKTLSRMFNKHLTRFISMICIVLLAVGFSSGLGTSSDKIKYSLADYYETKNVSDFIIKCTGDGFTDEDIEAVEAIFASDKIPATVNTGMSFDYVRTYTDENGDEQTETLRLYFLDDFDGEEWTVNVPDIVKEADISPNEDASINIAYSENADHDIRGYDLGEEIELDFIEILDQLSIQDSGEGLSQTYKDMISRFADTTVTVTVMQTVQSPLTFGLDEEPSYIQDEGVSVNDVNTIADLATLNCLNNILYLSSDLIPVIEMTGTKLLSTGDIYVAIGDRTLFNSFSSSYESYIEDKTEEILSALTDENGEAYAEVLTLYDNVSFNILNSYADKVEGIGWVLMVAFIAVTILVVVANMTRLMEEERGQIACLRTLGYSAAKIIFKYELFAVIAAAIGGVGAYFVGTGLAYLIYQAFNFSYTMPPMSSYFGVTFFIIVFLLIVAAVIISTLVMGIKMTNEKPAELLRPKPPKAGKKVILERVPFLWNRLSFKYKSTVRNVLRYKSRFFMTVVSVMVSMALVTAGMGILDLCLFGELASPTLVAIALVVIVFAGLLTGTIIYTLTNINISERNRELATLMVLGYNNSEVAGYIYREIYIDAVVGIIFGYPASAVLIGVVFNVLGIGTLTGISWFWWLAAPVVVILFTALVTLLLRRKIVGVDMNESLKANE